MTFDKDQYKSKMGAWMLATRPRTLPAAIAPVVLGSAMAVADKNFVWLPAICALIVALLLQIGVNLANDYFDYLKGIDNPEYDPGHLPVNSGRLAGHHHWIGLYLRGSGL